MTEFLGNNYKNLFLWTPFVIAFGAALYFTSVSEPNIYWVAIAFITSMIVLLFKSKNFVLRGITLFLFGFLYAELYTHNFVSTPILKHDLRGIDITATVTNIDISDDKTRLTLSGPANNLRIKNQHNANIKVSLSDDTNIPNIGDVIHAKVSVFPPSAAEVPESFDYARWAYFNNLTATGFIMDYDIISHSEISDANHFRNTIHKTANSFLTDSLLLGYKNAVPKSDKEIWTNVGVGHIWSISGFHLTLIGGWLFAFFYLIARCVGFITKRVPARIVATICAWGVLGCYVYISGASVATLRAFLMVSLGFAALLIGRNAISMRNVCIAFLILFLINPHFITTAGFQLSFAAIFGLIWFFDDKKFKSDNFIAKTKNGLYVATMTAIIATGFTMPFIATHFNSVPTYGLIGNLVLLPIFSVLIMPMVIIGTVMALFNLHFCLNWTTNIYEFALRIATHIADMPGATIAIPHIPNVALIIFIIGFMCLILIKHDDNSKQWIFRNINYLLCGACVSMGIIVVATNLKPVFYVTPDHELIGMVYDGKLEFNKARAANHYFAFNAFRALNNEPPSNTNVRRKCDGGVCIYKSGHFTLAYIQKFVPLQKHLVTLCNDDNINFIVSYFDIDTGKCNHKILHGGFVMYNSGEIKYTPFNRWWNNPHE